MCDRRLGFRRPGAGGRRGPVLLALRSPGRVAAAVRARTSASATGPLSSISGPDTSTSSARSGPIPGTCWPRSAAGAGSSNGRWGRWCANGRAASPRTTCADSSSGSRISTHGTRRGTASPRPGSPTAVRRLAESRHPGCTGVLTALRAGDRLVAAHFGLLGRGPAVLVVPRLRPGVRALLARPHPAAGRDRRGRRAGRTGHRPGTRANTATSCGSPRTSPRWPKAVWTPPRRQTGPP